MVSKCIKSLTYEEILPVWKEHLWPDRKSIIESHSAMLFLNGYDLKNMNYTPTFFGYYVNDNLAGVNSGHMCSDSSYRSRGLYVFPNYRNTGVGTQLLLATITQGFKEEAKFVWSYPRQTSWNTYVKAGFTLKSDWKKDEIGFNAYCVKER